MITWRISQKAGITLVFINCDGLTEPGKEIVMVRVLKKLYPKVKYLEIVQPSDIRANGILLAIDEDFQYYGFTKYFLHKADGCPWLRWGHCEGVC